MGDNAARTTLRGAVPYALAALAAIILCAPGLRFAYVFDDYDFLGRAQLPSWSHLLPDPNDIFYRPLSREVYFGILEGLSPGNPLLGHLVNLLGVGIVVVLVVMLTARLAGERAGVVASLLAAGFSQWPVLVGWVCASQDLFAILLVLVALHAAFAGARVVAILLFAVAMLSKETAAVT